MNIKKVKRVKKEDWYRLPSQLFYADGNGNYWVQYYNPDPSLEMVIEGQYPYCRYMSYANYGASGRPAANICDCQIAPDPGNINPFKPGADWNVKNRKYTIIVRFTPPPPNTDSFIPEEGKNIIYAGSSAYEQTKAGGFLAYRLFVPGKGYDFTGGVGLPRTYYRRVADGARVKVECPVLLNFNKLYHPLEKGEESGAGHIKWYRSSVDVKYAGNPQAVYMEAVIDNDPSKLLVIRWKAPTFPDTFNNKGIAGTEDMRYWSLSFCSRRGGTILQSLADYQTVIGKDGYVNLAVSFGAPRPAYVTPENGYTWVDLKNKSAPVLLYRNLAVSPHFSYTAVDVPGGGIVTDRLGEYLPVGQTV